MFVPFMTGEDALMLTEDLGKVLCGRLPDCKRFYDFDWQV